MTLVSICSLLNWFPWSNLNKGRLLFSCRGSFKMTLLAIWYLGSGSQCSQRFSKKAIGCSEFWVDSVSWIFYQIPPIRSNRPEVFLGKGVLKICSKFTGEYPRRSAILITLLYNFTEIALRHRRSPVNLLHILRTCFLKNTFDLWSHLQEVKLH